MFVVNKIKQFLFDKNNNYIEKEKANTIIEAKRIKTIAENERYDIHLDGNTPIKIVTIADCHGSLMQRELKDIIELPDIVFLLGDNFHSDLETVFDFFANRFSGEKISFIGVTGNHDEKNLLKEFKKITNIHRNIFCCKNLKIGGFSGSIKYKPDNYYTMFTNEESEQQLSELPDCDLLITHDKPCFVKPETVTSHSGLTGIGNYIRERNPKIVLHGHLHDRYVEQYENTIIRCCYRVENFNIYI